MRRDHGLGLGAVLTPLIAAGSHRAGVVLLVLPLLLLPLLLTLVLVAQPGNLLGGDAGGGIARTRRGLEKTLFQITIGLSIAFLAISIFSVVANKAQ